MTTKTTLVPDLNLNDGNRLPQLGFGVFQIPEAETAEASLDKLGGDYIDLYLIHWPVPHKGSYVETWEALCALQQEERVRSIGVSNFQVRSTGSRPKRGARSERASS
jgi:diketogulonate reductase-like aldo/keto reductase